MEDSVKSNTRKHLANEKEPPVMPRLLQFWKSKALNLAGKMVDILNGLEQSVSDAYFESTKLLDLSAL
jgi:hypothetical protein